MCWCTCVSSWSAADINLRIPNYQTSSYITILPFSLCLISSCFQSLVRKKVQATPELSAAPEPVPRCYIRAVHLATTSNLPSAHVPTSAVCGDRVASWEVQSSHPVCWCPPGGWVIGSPDVCRAAGGVCDSVCLVSAAASDLQTGAIIQTPGAHKHFSYHHYCFKAKV